MSCNKTLFTTLSRYNQWQNRRLYGSCATLSDNQRKENRQAFFHSIHGTLNHLLLADRLWLGRFSVDPFPVTTLNQELYSDFERLRREREVTDRAICDWIDGLDAAQLDGFLDYTSVMSKHRHRLRLADILLHFFNHQTHHRGQLTTLLSQVGVDYGVTDLLWLPGLEAGENY
ncbi:MAG: DinB family protein [Gammaproteobacteria bacterium]